jgi:uncharacterized integral membrane protein
MHSIQDTILTVGLLVFIVAMIPSVLGKEKPALLTSLPTGIVTAVFAGVYVSLNMWFSAVTSTILALLWLTLAAQKMIQPKD